MTDRRPVVIAVGNPYRRDDAAGSEVLRLLRERFGDDGPIRLVELDGEPVRLLQAWEGALHVTVVDAVRSDAAPGTLHVVEQPGAELAGRPSPGAGLGGGHLLGITEAVDLARALDLLPPSLVVIGIEGADFGHGVGLSAAVQRACREVAEQLSRSVATTHRAADQ